MRQNLGPCVAALSLVVAGSLSACDVMVKGLEAEEAKLSQEREKLEQQLAEMKEKVPAVFAKKDITEGSTITEQDLEIREIARAELPENASQSTAELVGRKAKYTVPAGSPLSKFDIERTP